MEKKEIVDYWVRASNATLNCSGLLSNRYSYALSSCIFRLKVVKGTIVVKTSNPTDEHNLVRLVEAAGIVCSEEQLDLLADVTTFNIKGRYDDYKNQFYKIATKEYAEKYFQKSEQLIIWLQKNFQIQ